FTLVRLTREEQLQATRLVVEKLNKATGPVSVVVPLGGGSVMDIQGGAFWDPDLNEQCRTVLRQGFNKNIQYREVEGHINDNSFADVVLAELVELMGLV
ncbi:MAG: UPF0261 family protein, partial [Anaerolineae bacterium]